ncbi:hypothetical protein STUTZSP0542_17560 [Stutzerimonas marianensis]
MLGLPETLSEAAQTLVGIAQGVAIGIAPLVALQLLPDFQHFPGLVNHPLREVLLEIFLVRHFPFSWPVSTDLSRAMVAACYHLTRGAMVPA